MSRKLDRIAGGDQRCAVGQGGVHHHVTRLHLRVGQRLADSVQWPARHTGRLQLRQPVRHRLGEQHVLQNSGQFLGMGGARVVIGKARIIFWQAQRLA